MGESFESAGLKVKAVYDDGTEKELNSKEYTVSEPEMNMAGTPEVTVSYKEGETTRTASFTITVKAVKLTRIEIMANPNF